MPIQIKREPLHSLPKSPEQTWNEARDTEEGPFRMLKVLSIDTQEFHLLWEERPFRSFIFLYFSLFFFFFFFLGTGIPASFTSLGGLAFQEWPLLKESKILVGSRESKIRKD